jgi:hypothetical protein
MSKRNLCSAGLFLGGAVLVCAVAYALGLFAPEEPAGGAPADPGAPAAADSPDRGPLVLDEPAVDLGIVKGKVSHRFTYTNQGPEPLTFTKVTGSCACMTSKPDRIVLRPGESGFVNLETDVTRKEPGPHRFQLVFEYQCGGRHLTAATLKVSYQPDLHVTPNNMELIVTEGRGARVTFALMDYRKQSLKVRQIRTSEPALRARITEYPTEYQPGWRHTVEVTFTDPPGETRGSFRGRLQLDTTDPDYPILTVDIVIRRLDRLRLVPPAVVLGPERTAAVLIRDSLGEKVELGECVTGGLATPAYAPGAEAVKKVSLSLPAGAVDPAKYPATIWIRVTKPCERRFPVTVTLESSKRS